MANFSNIPDCSSPDCSESACLLVRFPLQARSSKGERKLPLKGLAVALALPVVGSLQSPAQAIRFRFDYDQYVPDSFRSAAEEAGEAWSSVLKDDTVVELRIEYQDLSEIGGNVLGGAQPGRVTVGYNQYINALFDDAISNDDYAGIDTLQLSYTDKGRLQDFHQGYLQPSQINLQSNDFKFVTDYEFVAGNSSSNRSANLTPHSGYFHQVQDSPAQNDSVSYSYSYSYSHSYSTYESNYEENYSRWFQQVANQPSTGHGYTYIGSGNNSSASFLAYDNNGSNNNRKVSLTRAQAKALGIEKPQKRGLDAIIKLNSSVDWDVDRSDGVDQDRYDLSSVLQHEIGHALGIVSSVDALDFLSTSNQAETADNTPFSYLTPMDFLRYSPESSALRLVDVSLGGEKYFSLDGGQSVVRDEQGRAAYFSTGSTAAGGDGYQGSHWRDTYNSLGIMDPSLRKGQINQISSLDLTLLDVVGWDLEDNDQQKAEKIGINLQGYKQWLAKERQEEIDLVVAAWGDLILEPEAAFEDALVDTDIAFQQMLSDEFDELARKLIDEGGLQNLAYRDQEVNQFYRRTSQASRNRKNVIRDTANVIYSIDQNVRQWLSLSTEALSVRLESASAMEINRLSNIVKNMPWEERVAMEQKLEVAIAPFVDRPSQLVEDLLDTSGPANPIGYGDKQWWFWFQEGEESGVNNDSFSPVTYYSNMAFLTADTADEPITAGLEPISGSTLSLTPIDSSLHASALEAQDIPEASSVLAMFGISALGAGLIRRKRA